LLLIVVLNDGANAVAAAITANHGRRRGMLPRDVFYGCAALVTRSCGPRECRAQSISDVGASYGGSRAFFCALARSSMLACSDTLGSRENRTDTATALPQSSRIDSCSFSGSLPSRRSD